MNSTWLNPARTGQRPSKRAHARAGQIAQRTPTIRKTIKESYSLFTYVSYSALKPLPSFFFARPGPRPWTAAWALQRACTGRNTQQYML